MNKYINRFAILAGCTLVLTACDENSWNDKLDGFDDINTDKATSTVEYTMTQVDYATIAGLSTANAYAKAEGVEEELKAVGSQGYFTDVIDAETYVPFFLAQERFPYFALNNGSYARVTYETVAGQPAEVTGAVNAEKYTVTTDDYIAAWESDTDYTEAFAPSCTAAKNIPTILKGAYPDAEADQYVIVSYNQSNTDPVFGGATSPEEPAFELSNVLGSITKDASVDIAGYVAAVSTQGPIISDASGSVFAYLPTNNSDLKIGDQVEFTATVSSYNYGYQLAKESSPEIVGSQEVTYPTAKTWTGSEIDAFVADAMASGADPIKPVYSQFKGTVAVSGNYINIILDGTTVQLSPYGAGSQVKAALTDGAEVTLEGYVVAIASKGKFLNTIVTKVDTTPIVSIASASVDAVSRAVTVASTVENAMYVFDGSKWTEKSNMTVLSHADYQAMGQRYDNLSGETPKELLPLYLKQNYPFAVADEIRYVVYNYYNGSTTVVRCAECRYTGSEWTGG
ncbi:MAG: hypothetical protein HDS75_04470, partial [Bacteroidales bacterium]|nr:hypothetical protein [Bacteroidales bacterium]